MGAPPVQARAAQISEWCGPAGTAREQGSAVPAEPLSAASCSGVKVLLLVGVDWVRDDSETARVQAKVVCAALIIQREGHPLQRLRRSADSIASSEKPLRRGSALSSGSRRARATIRAARAGSGSSASSAASTASAAIPRPDRSWRISASPASRSASASRALLAKRRVVDAPELVEPVDHLGAAAPDRLRRSSRSSSSCTAGRAARRLRAALAIASCRRARGARAAPASRSSSTPTSSPQRSTASAGSVRQARRRARPRPGPAVAR